MSVSLYIKLSINCAGCEVNPDVNISAQKYNIKLFVPGSDGMQEVWIRADTVSSSLRPTGPFILTNCEVQYAGFNWTRTNLLICEILCTVGNTVCQVDGSM